MRGLQSDLRDGHGQQQHYDALVGERPPGDDRQQPGDIKPRRGVHLPRCTAARHSRPTSTHDLAQSFFAGMSIFATHLRADGELDADLGFGHNIVQKQSD